MKTEIRYPILAIYGITIKNVITWLDGKRYLYALVISWGHKALHIHF